MAIEDKTILNAAQVDEEFVVVKAIQRAELGADLRGEERLERRLVRWLPSHGSTDTVFGVHFMLLVALYPGASTRSP